MAERLTRKFHGDKFNVYSAGSHPATGVNAGAVEVLAELGIDASDHQPRTLRYWQEQDVLFDYIVTVCGDAHDSCPRPPKGTKVTHIGFEDPSHQPLEINPEKRKQEYQRVRDQIVEMSKDLPQTLAALD